MGICSISANYSPDNSLSNGIIILESFFTNLDILATKVVRKEKNPILGTSRGRGLRGYYFKGFPQLFLRFSQLFLRFVPAILKVFPAIFKSILKEMNAYKHS
jgi:hypothetical protein